MELNFKNINLENQLIKNSFIEKYLGKKGNLRSKEIEKHKTDSLKMSVFIGLFAWLAIGIYIENILKALAFSTVFTIVVFIILLQLPLAKKRKETKKFEADLPFFLLHLATEIKIGKSFSKAIKLYREEMDTKTNIIFLILLKWNKSGHLASIV